MESTYRNWLHAKKEISGLWNIDDLRRDLQTTIGTAKWQLEEFEKEVNSSYKNGLVDDSKNMHRDFIVAMDSQVKKVEKCLNKSAVSHGKPPHPRTGLDDSELDDLALFLSGSSATFSDDFGRVLKKDRQAVSLQEVDKKEAPENLKESSYLREWGRLEAIECSPGHRKTASASADISSWKISVSDDSFNPSSSDEQPGPTPRKFPSFSGFLNRLESVTTQLKCPRNGYRKLKLLDRGQEADTHTLPQSKQLTKGVTSCYEGSTSCLDGCDDCYDKPLHGWYGAVRRQLQRSQYHVQYCRPVQLVFSIVLLFCFIVLLAMHST